ncbi:hypothetical protein DID88_008911 [Monilinia fructigena]|uniref:Uncharacterized protein n=1 Tax=Monilinia fructigena TaxID=38457 RepID=A0A395J6U6_9HELO|nr:hypothetical protein DID88_008911 [Monilinia fructigena]
MLFHSWVTRYTTYRKINRMSPNQQIDLSHPSNDVEKGTSPSIPHDLPVLSPYESRTHSNITLASIGASVYGLGFVDATLCSVFGAVVGVLPVAYVAGWGPWSGNRTLICARFTMGWWPVKICVILNVVILLGYSMIDAVVAGQMLSAVSPNGSLSVEVGIVVSAVLTFTVTTFGSRFDLNSKSTVEGTTLAGNRLSFFSICLSAAITYAPIAADFFVYCDPKIASRWKVFAATLLGLSLSFTFTFVIGAGLASGIPNNPSWEAAGAGSGALNSSRIRESRWFWKVLLRDCGIGPNCQYGSSYIFLRY